jgi:hypothetical protein
MRLLAIALVVAGCGSHRAGDSAPDMAFVPAFAAHSKIDILFVIADFTLPPKLGELLNRFPQLIKALDAAPPASYHIGVITSDLGAGPFTYNQGQCHPDGDGARLQVMPAGSGPPPAPCSSFSLAGGVRYIDYDTLAGTTNVLGGVNLPTAFYCMASVSDAGCPYFQSLEAAYRAVSNPPPENAGCLRDDALLVIVFLQDTDDCSAPLDSPVFDRAQDPDVAGSFTPMRCAHAGIACGNPPRPLELPGSGGPFSDCVPLTQAQGGQLHDVQRYIDFFARPGGAKPDPSDVILASIAAPPAPFSWTETMPCAGAPNVAECPFLNASCVASTNSAFFGQPAVRLATVVGAGLTNRLDSVCETDYSPAMDGLAQDIIARLR